MSFLKMIVTFAVLVLALVGVFALLGLLAALVKYVFIFGLLALVGVVAYRALARPERPQLEVWDTDAELREAERALQEMRRKQLTK